MKKLIKLSLAMAVSLALMFSLALFSQAKTLNVDFKLNSVTSTAASISWDKVKDADGYNVYLYNYSKKTWVRQPNASSNKTLLKGLSNKGKNTIAIRTYEKVNGKYVYSSLSKSFSFYLAPSAVSNVSLSVSSNNSLTVKVSRPTGGYRLAYYLSSDNGRTWKGVKYTTSTTCTITGLDDATNYMVKVRAYHYLNDKASFGYYSSVKSITTDYNLKISSTTATTAKLTWSKVKGADGYIVYKYNNSTKKWVRLSNSYTNSRTFTGLSNTQKCYIKIRAYEKVNGKYIYSDYSKVCSFYTSPSKVSKVSLSLSSNNDLKITAAKTNGATSYAYYLSKDNGRTYKGVAYTSSLSYTVKGLDDATNYMVKVRPYHKSNGYTTWGTTSDVVSITTDYNIKYSSLTANSATVSWDKVEGAGGYRVYKYNNSTKKWVRQANAYTNSIELTGLSNAEQCSIKISSYEKVNGSYVISDDSDVCSFYPVPNKVSNVTLEMTGANTLKISVPKTTGATGYAYCLSSDGGKTWKILKFSTALSCTTTVDFGKNYLVKVRSYHRNNAGAVRLYADYSSIYEANLRFNLGIKSVFEKSASIQCDKILSATGYEIYAYNYSTKTWSKKTTTTGNFATITGLTGGTQYQYKVRSYQTINGKTYYSIYSLPVSFYTAPAAVSSFNLKVNDFNKVALSLTKATGAQGYEIALSSDNGKTWSVSGTTSSLSFTTKALNYATEYQFKVRSYHSYNGSKVYSAYSDVKSIVTESITELENFKVSNVTGSSATLTWDNLSDATYKLEIYSKNKWVVLADALTSPTYNLTSLDNSLTYDVKVRVTATVKSNSGSVEGTAVNYSFILAPTAIEGLVLNKVSSSSATIDWTHDYKADGYDVYLSTNNSSYKKITTTKLSTYEATGLTNGTNYSFKVKAYTTNDGVKAYNEFSYPVATNVLLSAPTSLKELDANDNTKIHFTWNKVDGAKEYTIYKFSPFYNDWKLAATTSDLEYNYSNSSTSAASYLYKVVARYGNIVSEDSELICIDKYGVSTSFVDCKTEISWPSVPGAKGYTVSLLSTDGSTLTQLDKTSSTNTVLRLAPQSIQSLQIKAYSDAACKNYIGYAVREFSIFTNPMQIITNPVGMDQKLVLDTMRSQILFLNQAINNTKQYKGEVILDAVSSFKFAASNFGVSGVEVDLDELLGQMGDTGLDEEQTETTSAFFNNGQSFSNGAIRLDEAFAPFSNDSYLNDSQSELYLNFNENGKIFTNAITSPFHAKKLANGNYEYTIKLAEETNSSKIHQGFMSVIDANVFGDDAFELGSVNYGYGGGTTISAIVSADGLLEKYVVKSPFKFTKAKFNFAQGDSPISITLDMNGYTNYEYTFTK